jgi:hypothetical protein
VSLARVLGWSHLPRGPALQAEEQPDRPEHELPLGRDPDERRRRRRRLVRKARAPRPLPERAPRLSNAILLGTKKVPAAAYYGVQTMRAIENFRISGVPISLYPDLIRALAMVKKAAALANHESARCQAKILKAIEAACDDHRGQAARSVRRRRLPGRRRHVHQHERERGDREPRARASWAGRASTRTAIRTTT